MIFPTDGWAVSWPHVLAGQCHCRTCWLGSVMVARVGWAVSWPHVLAGQCRGRTCCLGSVVAARVGWAVPAAPVGPFELSFGRNKSD